MSARRAADNQLGQVVGGDPAAGRDCGRQSATLTVGASSDVDGLWAIDTADLARIISGAVSATVQVLLNVDHLERLTKLREVAGTDDGLAIVDGMEAARASAFAVSAAALSIEAANRGSSFHAEFADRLRTEAAAGRLAILLVTACPDDEARRSLTRKLVLRYGDDRQAAGDKLADLLMDRLIDDELL